MAAAPIHPLTLRFADDGLERELRATSVKKLHMLTGLVAIFTLLNLLGSLASGRNVVWSAVLCLGESLVFYQTRHIDPLQVHRLCEVGVKLTLLAAVGIHLCSDFGANAPGDNLLDATLPPSHDGSLMPITGTLFVAIVVVTSSWWLHLGFDYKMSLIVLPVFAHSMNPMFPAIVKWEEEVQLFATALLTGTVLGYMLERTAREAFLMLKERQGMELRLVQQEAKAEAVELRGLAHRVINHTSKRVMCNTVQVCNAVLGKLAPSGAYPELVTLLKAHSTESVTGFHMCQSVLLRANMSAKAYASQGCAFSLNDLFDELAFFSRARVQCCVSGGDKQICADKLVLQSILFNASQNALTHGREGATIQVEGRLDDGVLNIKVVNEPGHNHAKLLSIGCDDLIEAQLPRSELTNRCVGAAGSTYLGLHDIKTLCDINPNCCCSLRVLPTKVVFELTFRPTMQIDAEESLPPKFQSLSRSESTSIPDALNVDLPASTLDSSSGGDGDTSAALCVPPEPSSQFLRGITIIHADDDVMPRIFMEGVLECVGADSTSLVLGEQYEELLTLPKTVASIAKTRGHDRVIVILDRFLEISGWPGLDGIALCRQMREKQHFKGLIIILSANDEPEDVEAALKAGADAHAAKGLNASIQKLTSMLSCLHAQKFPRSAVMSGDVSRP